MTKKFFLSFLCIIACINNAIAYDKEVHKIDIINHKFVPDTIYSTQEKIIKLHINNKDTTIEEFESFDLKREKLVPGKRKIIITVGPLKPGEYTFFGEFHQETAQGKLIVK